MKRHLKPSSSPAQQPNRCPHGMFRFAQVPAVVYLGGVAGDLVSTGIVLHHGGHHVDHLAALHTRDCRAVASAMGIPNSRGMK